MPIIGSMSLPTYTEECEIEFARSAPRHFSSPLQWSIVWLSRARLNEDVIPCFVRRKPLYSKLTTWKHNIQFSFNLKSVSAKLFTRAIVSNGLCNNWIGGKNRVTHDTEQLDTTANKWHKINGREWDERRCEDCMKHIEDMEESEDEIEDHDAWQVLMDNYALKILQRDGWL